MKDFVIENHKYRNGKEIHFSVSEGKENFIHILLCAAFKLQFNAISEFCMRKLLTMTAEGESISGLTKKNNEL